MPASELLFERRYVEESLPTIHPTDLRVGIIGAGNLGLTLAIAFQELGHLSWMVVRSPQQRQELRVAFEGIALYDNVNNVRSLPDVIIIATPDSAIEEVSITLAKTFADSLDGKVIIHCSGALGKSVLHGAGFGAKLVSAHPFETFSHPSTRVLKGCPWGIECNPEDEYFISSLIGILGGIPVMLPEYAVANKSLYHLSAVVASNYVYSTLATASRLAERAHIHPSVFLPAIVRTTVENALTAIARGMTPPLTGPIARADIQTLKSHCDILQDDTSMLKQYCYGGLSTAEFAFREGKITDAELSEITSVFQSALDSTKVG